MKSKRVKIALSILCAALFLGGCATRSQSANSVAVNIQIVDRSGVTETVNDPEKVRSLERADFLQPQPYQKVSRIYARNEEGKVPGKLVVYHENGQPWQYLETKNGRAFGIYQEWYPSGKLRMKASVIEGIGDLNKEAMLTWKFDGKNAVWDEKGRIIAEIQYDKGILSGSSLYYHATSGALAKIEPYQEGKLQGSLQVFSLEGELLGETQYKKGVKSGVSLFKGDRSKPCRKEVYHKGLLKEGEYFDFGGEKVYEVVDGVGIRPVYRKGKLKATYEYRLGVPEGEVKTFRKTGQIESTYHLVQGAKDGEEWCYYESNQSSEKRPMLYIDWRDDEIHGVVRTWYPNGALESEKEMAHNKKQGKLLAWYNDGSLMMVEEYDKDSLISGKYLKKGEETPISRVISGSGTATIYDEKGYFLRKISYEKGIPIESE